MLLRDKSECFQGMELNSVRAEEQPWDVEDQTCSMVFWFCAHTLISIENHSRNAVML